MWNIHRQIVPRTDIEKTTPNLRWLKEYSIIATEINTVIMKLNHESVFDVLELIAENDFDRWDSFMVRGMIGFAKELELPRTQELATELYEKMRAIRDDLEST